jgi:hypothetical protein
MAKDTRPNIHPKSRQLSGSVFRAASISFDDFGNWPDADLLGDRSDVCSSGVKRSRCAQSEFFAF